MNGRWYDMNRSGTARLFAVAVAALPVPAGADVQNWILEHFGATVTILRLGKPGAAGVLLSCDGRDRRLAITLPETAAERLKAARDGTLLVRPTGSPGVRSNAVIARFTMTRGRVFTVSEHGSGATDPAVLPFARLLARQPGSLDVLIHAGTAPVTWSDLMAYHLPVPTGPGDAASIAEFLAVCSRRGATPP